MGGVFSKPKQAPAPAPAPAAVTAEKAPDPGEAVRRKRIADGRAGVQSTVGGDSGAATKTLLGA